MYFYKEFDYKMWFQGQYIYERGSKNGKRVQSNMVRLDIGVNSRVMGIHIDWQSHVELFPLTGSQEPRCDYARCKQRKLSQPG